MTKGKHYIEAEGESSRLFCGKFTIAVFPDQWLLYKWGGKYSSYYILKFYTGVGVHLSDRALA